MKCPKCGQEFEGHPSECPACHVKFVFKKKEEEKITFDESGNAINSEQVNEDAGKAPKSDEEIKKEIIEKHKNEFVASIKLLSLRDIFQEVALDSFLFILFFKINQLFISSGVESISLSFVLWPIIIAIPIVSLVRFIICLLNICSKNRQQIIMNKQYENYKRRGKDGVRRFFSSKAKCCFLIISQLLIPIILLGMSSIFTSIFTFGIPVLTLTEYIVLSVCTFLCFVVGPIICIWKLAKKRNKIITAMYPEYKQYDW